MDKIKNFRDLEIWKLGKEIVVNIYQSTNKYPTDERFGIITQMRRASISIPSNIAEGFNRFHNKEYKQFLFIALGSCAELETQVEIGKDLGYLDQETTDQLISKIVIESKMIRSLTKN